MFRVCLTLEENLGEILSNPAVLMFLLFLSVVHVCPTEELSKDFSSMFYIVLVMVFISSVHKQM